MDRLNKPQSFYSIMTNPYVLLLILAVCLISVPRGFAGDVGTWNYVSYAWMKHGLAPYAGAVENKTPGIFYLLALSHKLFGFNFWFPEMVAIVVMLLTTLLIYHISREVDGRHTGVFAMILFGLCCCDRDIRGFSVTTEMFMALFTVAALYIVCRASYALAKKQYMLLMFCVGICLGCAIAFKQIAVVSVIGMFAFYVWQPAHLRSRYRSVWRDCCAVAAGIVCVTLFSIIPLLLSGVSIYEYLEVVWLLLLRSGRLFMITRLIRFFDTWYLREIMVFYPLLVLFWFMRTRLTGAGIPWKSITAWLCIEFFAVNAAGTYFSHQLLQLIPALSIVAGIVIKHVLAYFQCAQSRKRVAQCVVMCFLILLPYRSMWTAVTFDDRSRTSSKIEEFQKMAKLIQNNTEPSDTVFIYAKIAGIIYVLAERAAPSRHFNKMFAHVEKFKAEMKHDLETHPPRMIIYEQKEKNLAWLKKFMAGKYRQISSRRFTVGDDYYKFAIFLRIDNH